MLIINEKQAREDYIKEKKSREILIADKGYVDITQL